MLAARVCPHSCETPRVRMNGHCVRRSNPERLTLRLARAWKHARVSPNVRSPLEAARRSEC